MGIIREYRLMLSTQFEDIPRCIPPTGYDDVKRHVDGNDGVGYEQKHDRYKVKAESPLFYDNMLVFVFFVSLVFNFCALTQF